MSDLYFFYKTQKWQLLLEVKKGSHMPVYGTSDKETTIYEAALALPPPMLCPLQLKMSAEFHRGSSCSHGASVIKTQPL